jgi:general secretion pathway protein M
VTPALVAKLSPAQQRALALTLFFGILAIALLALLGPLILMHRHYDKAIAETTDRVAHLRRIAAQAPELRRALDTMKERDSRRFFLRNIAPNLAGAEMQELVKAAIESNGGRITTSQNTSPREDGRFKQIGVNVQFFATTPSLQKLLGALESQQPYLLVDNITIRPLNAFRGFKPGPGMEPEVNVQLDVSAFAYADTKPVAAASAVATPK